MRGGGDGGQSRGLTDDLADVGGQTLGHGVGDLSGLAGNLGWGLVSFIWNCVSILDAIMIIHVCVAYFTFAH